MDTRCTHCGEKRPPLGFAPFPTELGQRVSNEICQPCWAGWMQKQMQLINHFGLDVSNPEAQEFLFANLQAYLFGETLPTAEIDTSKEGTIEW
jgi:Fe-S cluster biosynthesis and repair protein YggX